jgi:hypothetical protein
MNIPWGQLISAFGALIVAYAWLQFFQRSARAIGTITKIVTRHSGSSGYTKVPEINFIAGGAKHTFQPSLVILGDADEKRIGTAVPVAYNPANPQDAEIATPVRRYLKPIIPTIIYLAFLFSFYG